MIYVNKLEEMMKDFQKELNDKLDDIKEVIKEERIHKRLFEVDDVNYINDIKKDGLKIDDNNYFYIDKSKLHTYIIYIYDDGSQVKIIDYDKSKSLTEQIMKEEGR